MRPDWDVSIVMPTVFVMVEASKLMEFARPPINRYLLTVPPPPGPPPVVEGKDVDAQLC